MTEDEVNLATAAHLADCSISTILRAASDGELTCHRRARSTFLRSEIEEFARRRAARQRKASGSQPRQVEIVGEPAHGR